MNPQTEIPQEDLIVLGATIRNVVSRMKQKELSTSLAFISDRDLGLLGITINYILVVAHRTQNPDQLAFF